MPSWRELQIEPGSVLEGVRVYQKSYAKDHLTAIVTMESDVKRRLWWHLSISWRTNTSPPKFAKPIPLLEIQDAIAKLLPTHILMCEMYPPYESKMPQPKEQVRHFWEIPLEFAD